MESGTIEVVLLYDVNLSFLKRSLWTLHLFGRCLTVFFTIKIILKKEKKKYAMIFQNKQVKLTEIHKYENISQ